MLRPCEFPDNVDPAWQCAFADSHSLGILISFVYAGAMGPITYTIIAETSSVRLRALSTGVGRGAYYVAEIPLIYLNSKMLNGTGWNRQYFFQT